MTVRDARFADIPGIVLILKSAYSKSHYAREGLVNVDEKEAKRLLAQAVQRHGGTNGGATFVQVAETNGTVTGVILGTLSRVYAIGDKLMASDLFWVCVEDVEPADPMALMRNMIEWAKACPYCVEVKCGTTAVVAEDPKRPGRILERLGLKHYGEIYRGTLS